MNRQSLFFLLILDLAWLVFIQLTVGSFRLEGFLTWIMPGLAVSIFLISFYFLVFEKKYHVAPSDKSLVLAVLVISILGIYNLFRAFILPLQNFPYLSLTLTQLYGKASLFASALSGAVLLYLANGLRRRKRVAWAILISQFGLVFILQLVTEANIYTTILAGILIIWLFFLGPACFVRSDPDYLWRGIQFLVGVLVFSIFLGMSGYFLLGKMYHFRIDFWTVFRQTALMITSFSNPELIKKGLNVQVFETTIYVISAAGWCFALWMVNRPVNFEQEITQFDRERAKEIVGLFGMGAQSNLALMNDKHYFFSPGGSVIAFTVQGRTALTLGDPIGPRQDASDTINRFRLWCEVNDWLPVFCLAMPNYLQEYRNLGFKVFCLGHEAIIDLEPFTLKGNASKTFRKRYNRMTHQGFQVIIHEPGFKTGLVQELRSVSDAWLRMTNDQEKRFLLMRFDENEIINELIAAVHTPSGEVIAFVNLLAGHQINEIGIDLMRRKPDAEPGAMDFLFTSLFLWARDQGYESFNLGLSPLCGVGVSEDAITLEKIANYVYENGTFFYDFKGVNTFKTKFRPRWKPQYLIYPGYRDLLPILLSLVKAVAGENETLLSFFGIRRRREKFPNEELPRVIASPEGNFQ